tara:strand:+ start:539 stop:658 length:120 start_codon:yes stop_codon:yes gene_type:complete
MDAYIQSARQLSVLAVEEGIRMYKTARRKLLGMPVEKLS